MNNSAHLSNLYNWIIIQFNLFMYDTIVLIQCYYLLKRYIVWKFK